MAIIANSVNIPTNDYFVKPNNTNVEKVITKKDFINTTVWELEKGNDLPTFEVSQWIKKITRDDVLIVNNTLIATSSEISDFDGLPRVQDSSFGQGSIGGQGNAQYKITPEEISVYLQVHPGFQKNALIFSLPLNTSKFDSFKFTKENFYNNPWENSIVRYSDDGDEWDYFKFSGIEDEVFIDKSKKFVQIGFRVACSQPWNGDDRGYGTKITKLEFT